MTDTWDISQHASGPQGPRSELVLPYQRPFGLRVSAREKKKSQHFNSLSIQFFTWRHLNIYRRRCRWMHVCARSHTHTHTHKDTQRRTHAGEHCMHVCTQAHTRAFVPILSDLFSSLWWKLKVEQGTVEKRQPWSCVCVCVCVCVSVWVCVSVCVSLPHEYSLSNLSSVFRHLGRQQTIILCHYGRCYHSASLQPQQPQTGIYSQWNRHESSSLWLSGRRAGRQTMPPRWEAPFNNVSCNIAKWGWTLKSRLSVVDADYVEITFLRRARENVTKAQIGQTVSICLLH